MLQPYLSDRGGVVHVRVAADAPASAFVRQLRSEMEYGNWRRRWISVQIDGDNSATHYVSDMVEQLETSLEVSAGHDSSVVLPSTINVGTNNQAGGSVTVSGNQVSINFDSRVSFAQITRRVAAIRRHLENQEEDVRLAVVLSHSPASDEREIKAFVDQVWEGSLSSLADSGALLVYLAPEGRPAPEWAPPACVDIELHPHLDELSSRQAVADLTAIAVNQRLFTSDADAAVYARTLVASSTNLRDLFTSFANSVRRLRTDHGTFGAD